MTLDQLRDERILFATELDGWRDAIELVSRPLLEAGAITREYVDAMLASIAAGGTYIDLGYGIALAHSRPENGVLETGLAALWVRPAVLLNDDPAHPISLFLCLAATDSSSHLATMAQLGELLTNDAARNSLLAATSAAEVTAVLNAGEPQ